MFAYHVAIFVTTVLMVVKSVDKDDHRFCLEQMNGTCLERKSCPEQANASKGLNAYYDCSLLEKVEGNM